MNLQKYYETVMQLSHGVVVTLDLDGCIIHGNTLLEELTGYSMRDLAGRDWFETFIAEEEREASRRNIFGKAHDQNISKLSGAITTRSGDRVYIDWNLKPLPDSNGEIVSVLCVGQDVTSHVQRQKGLQRERRTLLERNKELNCLFEISVLLGDTDRELECLLENLVNLLPSGFQHPDKTTARLTLDRSQWESASMRPGLHSLVEPIVVGGQKRGEITIGVKNEETNDSIFIADEKDLLSTVAHQVAIVIAKKEAKLAKKQLEQQLRQADRLAKIGQFTAGVAHEINEPLANILGFAELALQSKELPEQVTTDLNSIVDSSLHAREVVRKLMFFGRQMPPTFVPTDLNEIVSQALRITASGSQKQGIAIHCDFDETLPEFMADPQHIKQLVVNLVANAIQAMEGGGELTITTINNKNDAYLIVEDTGPGMENEELKQIFTPFYTTKDVDKGTGLGLSVVHGIVKAHDGFIQVHSTPGQGTRFEVAFPCQKNNGKVE